MTHNLTRDLFVLFLVVAVPALSFATARPSRIRPIPRPALYLSAVLSQCLLAALGVAVVWTTLPGFSMAGFRAVPLRSFYRWTAFLSLASFAAVGIMALLERGGWWPEEPEVTRLLLPETRREKVMAVLLVAPSAGVCEEFLYRGYLLPQLSQHFSSWTWGWVASSVAFGLAHSYQGAAGILQAALLGLLLAYPMVQLRSVYPSMAAHFVIDALLLAWLGPKLLSGPRQRRQTSAGPDTVRSETTIDCTKRDGMNS